MIILERDTIAIHKVHYINQCMSNLLLKYWDFNEVLFLPRRGARLAP